MKKYILKFLWFSLSVVFGVASFGIFGSIEYIIIFPDYLFWGALFITSLFEVAHLGRPNPKTTDFATLLRFDIGMNNN